MLKNLYRMIRGNDGTMASDLTPEAMNAVAEIQYEKLKLDRDLAMGADTLMRSI